MKKYEYSLVASFKFAISGIAYALLHERNLRIHFTAAALVVYFAHYYDFARGEKAVLFLVAGFVIACELINTAIENTVDLETAAWNPLAKLAKDVAAGAVLVAGITSIAVAGSLFWQPKVLAQIWQDILAAPIPWVFVLIISVLWIFVPWKPSKAHPDKK